MKICSLKSTIAEVINPLSVSKKNGCEDRAIEIKKHEDQGEKNWRILQEYTTTLNVYEPNSRASKYVR